MFLVDPILRLLQSKDVDGLDITREGKKIENSKINTAYTHCVRIISKANCKMGIDPLLLANVHFKVHLKPQQNKKGQKNLGYPRKKQSFSL